MALSPYFMRDFWGDDIFSRPSRLFDQRFGLELSPNDILEPLAPLPRSWLRSPSYIRTWRPASATKDAGSTVVADKEKFQISLDVQQFLPEEITVKTVENTVIVEGKHEEKKDEHGFISRHFIRKYLLPTGHDIQNVQSNLSSDGILTISAPKVGSPTSNERVVPINQVGPVRSLETQTSTTDASKPIA